MTWDNNYISKIFNISPNLGKTNSSKPQNQPNSATNSNPQTERNLLPVWCYSGQPINFNFNDILGTTIQNQKDNQQPQKSKVIVIDDFKVGDKDFDHDDVVDDLSHGDVVTSIIDDTEVEKIQRNTKQNNQVAPILKSIRQRVENGENIGAVNLSFANTDTDVYIRKMYPELTVDNVDEKAPEIVNELRNKNIPKEIEQIDQKINTLKETQNTTSNQPESLALSLEIKSLEEQKEDYKTLVDFIEIYDEIDKLAALNVPVLVAAGNEHSYAFNTNGFNKNAIIVGAADSKKEAAKPNSDISSYNIIDSSNQNSLVDVNLQGVYTAEELPESVSSKLSFKGTVSGSYNSSREGKVGGTSFATPLAAKYARRMHDMGMTVKEINGTFAEANKIAQQNNRNTEEVLVELLEENSYT